MEGIRKRSVLLVEPNEAIYEEVRILLNAFYRVRRANCIEAALKEIELNSDICIIITNLNLNPNDHCLIDGLSIVRHSKLNPNCIPVIIYTTDLHPLARQEVVKSGAFKIFDKSNHDFGKLLLEAIVFARKIYDWNSKVKVSKINTAIVNKLLKKIHFVTPIQWNFLDENLYNCFFIRDSGNIFSYANSWAYICQSARNNGHKFFNGKCLLTIATEKKDDLENIQFSIINPLGIAAAKTCIELAERLREISRCPIIVKKISKSQEEYFMSSGKFRTFRPQSKKLDDQFDDLHPQVVVNLKAFMNCTNVPQLSGFCSNLKKFSQRNLSVKTTAPELFDDFWDVVLKWKRSFIKRYEDHGEFTNIPQNDEYYIDPYFPIFEYYSKHVDNRNTISSLVYVDNVPVGFSFLSKVSMICMGMYANIADTEFDGLSEYMVYQNLTKAYWCGYKYVNLGGTESKYLYDFYRRLGLSLNDVKSFEIETKYLIYD